MLLRTALILLLLISPALAAERWTADPTKSTLSFTATQNNSPIKGSFTSFTSTLIQEGTAYTLEAEVTLESVTVDYDTVADTLKNPDWFDVARFPKAQFKSTSFTPLTGNAYEVKGMLTLRDHTAPVTLHATLSPATATPRTLTGEAKLKRTTFGVGQGDWAKTDTVADDVTVTFSLTLSKP